jgi:hypothetical protein
MDDNLDFRILHVPTNSDKAYRDTLCMAYACAVMDLPMSDFYTGLKTTLKKETDTDKLIELLIRDLEIRVRRLLENK